MDFSSVTRGARRFSSCWDTLTTGSRIRCGQIPESLATNAHLASNKSSRPPLPVDARRWTRAGLARWRDCKQILMSPALTAFEQKTLVGIAEFTVSSDESVTLAAYGLGSGVGVAIYDPVARVGGLLHAMLPDSSVDQARAAAHPGMFVDTGVSALFRAAYQLGADKHRVIIAVAGGAQILDPGAAFDLGGQNAAALRELFLRHGLRIHAEQVGDVFNRTFSLHLKSGEVRVKTSGQIEETILCKSSTTT